MNKRQIFLGLLLLCASVNAFAQNVSECEKVVAQTVECINGNKISELTPLLAEDFTIQGQKGAVATKVLEMLFPKLGKINSFEKVSETTTDNALSINCLLDYATMGKKETTFVFNSDNKLRTIEFAFLQIKSMDAKQTKVQQSAEAIIRIPFRLIGKMTVVDSVLVDGVKRSFLFDSGSPMVIFNKKTSVSSLSSTKGIGGNVNNSDIEKVSSLDFYGLRMENQDVLVTDLSHLEANLGVEFYGLIGYNLFNGYDVLYDYEKQVITLIKSDKLTEYLYQNFAKAKQSSVPFETTEKSNHLPILKVEIGENQLKMALDCGATANTLNEKHLSPLKKHLKSITTANISGGDANKLSRTLAVVKKMKIGNEVFKNQSTTFTDTPQKDCDGIIGYEVLSKQKTLVSYSRKELIFIR